MNEYEYINDTIARETAFDEGYEAGKKAAVEEFMERLKAESAINIAGYWNYVIAEHQLEAIKRFVLEGANETNS